VFIPGIFAGGNFLAPKTYNSPNGPDPLGAIGRGSTKGRVKRGRPTSKGDGREERGYGNGGAGSGGNPYSR